MNKIPQYEQGVLNLKLTKSTKSTQYEQGEN